MNTKQNIGQLRILGELGTGESSIVRQAQNIETGKMVALKLYKDGFDECYQREIQAMKHLDHQNIIKFMSSGQGKIIGEDQILKKDNVKYIIMECGQNACLFDYIIECGRLKEDISRYLFNQILDALDHCQAQGVAHLDMKVENIIFDENFNIKIMDFGHSQIDQDQNKMLNMQVGTDIYKSPEQINKQEFNGFQSDIFSTIISLFIMVTGGYPFDKACSKNLIFKALQYNKKSIYWNYIEKKIIKDGAPLSDDFKNLIENSLIINPSLRLNIEQIRSHPWTKGPIASKYDVVQEFEQRKLKLQQNSSININSQTIEMVQYFEPEQVIIEDDVLSTQDSQKSVRSKQSKNSHLSQSTTRKIQISIKQFKRYEYVKCQKKRRTHLCKRMCYYGSKAC